MTEGYVPELSNGDKDPGFFGKTKYGVGAVSAGAAYKLLLVGVKSSAGSITTNSAGVKVTTEAEVDAAAGAGSELARMGYAALFECRDADVEVWLAAAPPSSPTAATATITIAGTWTTSGTWVGRIAGDEVRIGVASTDVLGTVATNIAAYVNAQPKMRVTAAAVGGVVTFTDKSPVIRGNDLVIEQDKTLIPSGMTSVAAGGAATTNGGVRFTGGAGVEDVALLLAALYPGRFHRIATAQIDATNLGKWEVQIDAKAGPFENRTEHVMCGSNSATQGALTSIAQTTLNNQRFGVLWLRNGETPGPEYAATMAARRAVLESGMPNQNYDEYELKWLRPQAAIADRFSRAERLAALNAGITPLNTTANGGSVYVVRGVTTRSQVDAGTLADDRTIDWSEAVTPDWVRDDLELYWVTGFKPANPHVQDDVEESEQEPPAGVATPKHWNNDVMGKLLDYQQRRILTRVAENPAKSVFNRQAKRIASRVPTVTLPLQHQIEVLVEQVPYGSAA